MSRPIDGDNLTNNLKMNRLCILQECENDGAAVFDEVVDWIRLEPTLTPQNEPRMINADKLAKRIAGHNNYHGDSILAAIYCAAEGKENDAPIKPIETPQNEPLTLISMNDEVPPDNERVLVYRPCMVDSDTGPYSVQWGWSAKKDGSHWAHLSMLSGKDNNVPTKEPNEPFTTNELLEMNQTPIWVVDMTINRGEWCYWKDGRAYSCESSPEYYDLDDYGKWVAYCCPPWRRENYERNML